MDGEFNFSVLCPRLIEHKKCGTTLERKLKFCPECGGKVDQAWFRKVLLSTKSSASEDMYICDGITEDDDVCGKEVSIYAKFCSNCGTRRRRISKASDSEQSLTEAGASNLEVPSQTSSTSIKSEPDVSEASDKSLVWEHPDYTSAACALSSTIDTQSPTQYSETVYHSANDSLAELQLSASGDMFGKVGQRSGGDCNMSCEMSDLKVEESPEKIDSVDTDGNSSDTKKASDRQGAQVTTEADRDTDENVPESNTVDTPINDSQHPNAISDPKILHDAAGSVPGRLNVMHTDGGRKDDNCQERSESILGSDNGDKLRMERQNIVKREFSPSAVTNIVTREFSPSAGTDGAAGAVQSKRMAGGIRQPVYKHSGSDNAVAHPMSAADGEDEEDKLSTNQKLEQPRVASDIDDKEGDKDVTVEDDPKRNDDAGVDNDEVYKTGEDESQTEEEDGYGDDDDDAVNKNEPSDKNANRNAVECNENDSASKGDGSSGLIFGKARLDLEAKERPDMRPEVQLTTDAGQNGEDVNLSLLSIKDSVSPDSTVSKMKKKKKKKKKDKDEQSVERDAGSRDPSGGNACDSNPRNKNAHSTLSMTSDGQTTKKEQSAQVELESSLPKDKKDQKEKENKKTGGVSATGTLTDPIADSEGAKAYNKKNTEPKNFVDPLPRNAKSGPKAPSGGVRAVPKIAVNFYVVMSADEFKFKPGDKVLIRFALEKLGGWISTEHILTVEKHLHQTKSLLLHGVVKIPTECFIINAVPYKYLVLRTTSKKGELECYEYIKKYSGSDTGSANRYLRIPKDRLHSIDEWHQYDGVMSYAKDEMSFFNPATWKDWFGKKLKSTKLAIEAMLPDWDDLRDCGDGQAGTRHLEMMIEKIDQVCFCVKNCFFNENRKLDEENVKEVLIEYITPQVEKFPKDPKDLKPESQDWAAYRLASACCALYLVNTYELKMQDSFKDHLTAALLLRVDKQMQRCLDYDRLIDSYLPSVDWQKKIAKCLLDCIKQLVRRHSAYSRWLLVMPLLHFLRNDSQPLMALRADTNHREKSGAWWGINDLTEVVENHKYYYSPEQVGSNIDFYMEHLGPLFTIDKLIPRTLLCIMSVEHLPRLVDTFLFPPDACLANCFYFIHTMNYWSFDDKQKFYQKMEVIFQRVGDVLELWLQTTNDSLELLETKRLELNVHHRIAFDLLHELMSKVSMYGYPTVVHGLRVLVLTISNMQRLYQLVSNREGIQDADKLKNSEFIRGSIRDLQNRLHEWLNKVLAVSILHYSYAGIGGAKYDHQEIDIYKELVAVRFFDEEATITWKKYIANHIDGRIAVLAPQDQVHIFCLIDFTNYPSDVEDCFSARAFKILEDSVQSRTGNFNYVFDAADNGESAKKIRGLLSKMLEKAWPASTQDEVVIEHILTWPSFSRFLNLFYGKSRRAAVLSDECQERITVALSLIDSVISRLLSGDIIISLLKLVTRQKESFLNIFCLIEKSSESGMTSVPAPGINGMDKSQVLSTVIDWRNTELKHFSQITELVRHFINMCTKLKSGHVDNLKASLENDYDRLCISQLCKPKVYAPSAVKASLYTPNINFYHIPLDEEEMVYELTQYKESVVFNRYWDEKIQYLLNKPNVPLSVPLSQIRKDIWIPVKTKWTEMCNNVSSGDVTFIDVDSISNLFQTKYDVMQREFEMMCAGDRKVAAERISQVKNYHDLGRYQKGAELMLKLKDMFNLSGDFDIVMSLRSLIRDKKKPLNSVTKGLVDSGKQLEGITNKQMECLEVFLHNKKFAEWLRKEVKGPKEVKVLIDLAMISAAGQGDLEVQKVSCLHAAATGYASLIYDLMPTTGFKQFLPLCQQVWQKLEVDPELPRKFKDTARHLVWLNRIKESHGSVEVNALRSATAINAKGIYTVGNTADNTVAGGGKILVENIITLKLRLEQDDIEVETDSSHQPALKSKGRQTHQTLTLQHLNDLQSKLMLVAGKAEEGKKDVDRFVEILDGVTRLGNVYVKICNAGCTLFQSWKAYFYCDVNHHVYTQVYFDRDGKRSIKGLKSEVDGVGGVIKHILILCEFMDNCLKDWLSHIEIQRKESYYLNYFTTEQLVILQNELAKINMNTAENPVEISRHVYPLLSSIRKDCTLNDLQRAMHETFQQLADNDTRSAGVQRNASLKSEELLIGSHAAMANKDKVALEDDQEMEYMETEEEGNALNFIREMVVEGYPEKLAKRAVKEVGVNVTEGFLWCMEHVDDKDENDDSFGSEDSGSGVDAVVTVEDVVHVKPIEYRGLRLGSTKDTMTENLFNQIRNSKELLHDRLRKLWADFKADMDNSVSDYLSVIHIGCLLENLAHMDKTHYYRPVPTYLKRGKPNLILCSQAEVLPTVLSLYMHDPKLPLPGADEVLLCTTSTSAEEVELLLCRADGDARSEHHGKIYTLVHAELLDYDVAQRVDKSLETHCHALDNICLIIVCCGGNNLDSSYIINALERYRVRMVPLDIEAVQGYLKKHLTVDKVPAGVNPASKLDPERCCVRVIKSHRAGVGKTLKVQRLHEEIQRWKLPKDSGSHGNDLCVSIRLHSKRVLQSNVLKTLLQYTLMPRQSMPRIFHIDIAHEVEEGVDYLLFNLLVLGSIANEEGYVWCRSPMDLYIIEIMPPMQRDTKFATGGDKLHQRKKELEYLHHIFALLPSITCWSPMDCLDILCNRQQNILSRYPNAIITTHDQQMDNAAFCSAIFQRPFQYLQRFANGQDLRGIDSSRIQGDARLCIETLLARCGVEDPSWAELQHFVNFLDVQLRASELSVFCSDILAPELPGFVRFVVQFMMQMSKDFATRSLTISEETPDVARNRLLNDDNDDAVDNVVVLYGLKRRWETSPHPYLFFNADNMTFTFMGFVVNPVNGDILDPTTHVILANQVVPQNLYAALVRNNVNLAENFDTLPRDQKIVKMCRIMGVEWHHDPDPTYELTEDNVKKILAIYMRFRCNIPVIIMGETGCGKTRLIKFMCDLWKPPGSDMRNMILMKVHGGTTTNDIDRKVKEAIQLALDNIAFDPLTNVETVLFFDEANTTDAIGLIKEIMCDHTLRGKPLQNFEGLKLIAACNPYRKHSDQMINTLEHAGLGYHVDAKQTVDRLGKIPMRQLVYRVQALPQSMLPLVWDFGQLSPAVERLYIRQMVHRYIKDIENDEVKGNEEIVSNILAASQEFMRLQKDECSFVSLRDIDRLLMVMIWFFDKDELFDKMNYMINDAGGTRRQRAVAGSDDSDEEDVRADDRLDHLNDFTRSLILALGVCYHACLNKRDAYRAFIAPHFAGYLALPNGADTILENITCCQDVFLNEIQDLGVNIAKNHALKENLFMMVICIELRIPLFLVGKPGSSKSLAKTIVADAMQGEAARSELFRTLKSVHMVSYQCSPLSTPEGIVGTFRQCAKLQEGQDVTKFVSVVVLDEVGLAEDSDRMPLKTLHPLLEDGCEGDEEPAPHKKVGFIGISNWALDPAKMNRGILVQRGVPNEQELEQSAKGICQSDQTIADRIECLVNPMSKAYLELYNSTLAIREFFGLRDFYSLVKMVYGFSRRSNKLPTWHELKHAILRNFGGLDNVQPVDVFAKHLHTIVKQDAVKRKTDPDCDPATLIRASLMGDGLDSESRYLLILTENYAALSILQNELLNIKDAIIIFGSSFPKDQEYTQVCRNINRIKVCMETGRTVVLLNLENLYESLYDALNQYYVNFGDQRFVDLGLGTQRVKCRVHQTFRLIVVAEKQVVYSKFPIPLINRLEKHFLAMSTMLTAEQFEVKDRLDRWCRDFVGLTRALPPSAKQQARIGDVFIGYHEDAASSVVLQVSQRDRQISLAESASDTSQRAAEEEMPVKSNVEAIFEAAKNLLLQCATPESVVRLSNTGLATQAPEIYRKYFTEQKHDNILDFLMHILVNNTTKQLGRSVLVQLTTHSRLLLRQDVENIAEKLNFNRRSVRLETMNQFGTEQQFCNMLKEFMNETVQPKLGAHRDRLLLLQCEAGDVNADLIACARYNVWNEFSQTASTGEGRNEVDDTMAIHVVLIVQLPRIAGGCFVGFQGGRWLSYHIDDLHPHVDCMPSLVVLKDRSVSSLFEAALSSFPRQQAEAMDEGSDTDFIGAEDEGRKDTGMEVDIVSPDWVRVDISGAETINIDDIHLDNSAHAAVSRTRMADVRKALSTARAVLETTNDTDTLDVDRVIKNCVHSATAMLKDPINEPRQRKTRRLQLLLSLLGETEVVNRHLAPAIASGEMSLMFVLKKRIALLLKDKEETAMNAMMANNWLSTEATSFEAIGRAGTFRRALWQYLESRVAPLLAGIIAFADINSNFDLLVDDPDTAGGRDWRRCMWMDMLSSDEICDIKYRDLQTATQRGELTEFEVKAMGCGGSFFHGQLPFSWIIKSRIDCLIHQAKQQKNEDAEPLVARLLSERPLGQILDKACVAAGDPQIVIACYLHDFAAIVYKPLSKEYSQELELVINDIRYAVLTRQMTATQGEEDELRQHHEQQQLYPAPITIPSIHLCYDQIHGRLQLFSQLVQQWPECVTQLAQAKTLNDTPLDLKALYFVMESMAPVRQTFDTLVSCQQWVKKIHELSPLVLRLLQSINGSVIEQVQLQKHNVVHFNFCRYAWNRVCALQLFIDHMCSVKSSTQAGASQTATADLKSRCLPWQFWKSLGDDTDFKTLKSLDVVERILKICNKTAAETLFGKMAACPSCDLTMEAPIKLPCDHIVCRECFLERKALNDLLCPSTGCAKPFPREMAAEVMTSKKDATINHNRYKQHCNAFYMDLVSRLCFCGDIPPESGIVDKLMGYVTCQSKLREKLTTQNGDGVEMRTRKMALFEDSIDPTPVVRSFFLQLLLRSNIEEVHDYLEEYFESARRILRSDPVLIRELCVLCVQCLEDHYYSVDSQKDSKAERLVYTRKLLIAAEFDRHHDAALSISRLEKIAKARYGLGQAAEWIYLMYFAENALSCVEKSLHQDARKLIDSAASVCESKALKWPRRYLVKQLVRRYGMDVLKRIKTMPALRWIIPREAIENPNDQLPDRFVVLGDDYKAVREIVAKVVLGDDVVSLTNHLKTIRASEDSLQRTILLALYREITATYTYQDQRRRPTAEVIQKFMGWCQTMPTIMRSKAIVEELLKNQLGEGPLQLVPGQNARDLALVELLCHLKIVLQTSGDDNINRPYADLMNNPTSMQRSFLPTMPQDNLDEVRAAINATRTANENNTFYQCPNGHPYVIGNCGRPAFIGVCNQCGIQIGGQGYVLVAGNAALPANADTTAPGHVLGAPQQWTAARERSMSPAAIALMRMLLHMSMYIGSVHNAPAVCSLIAPAVAQNAVGGFLWQHIRFDLNALHQALGRSEDDVLLLLHLMLQSAINNPIFLVPGTDAKLATKQSREHWETTYVNNCVTPALNNINDRLQTANNQIVNDERLGNNPLMRLLYEVDAPDNTERNVENIQELAAVWRYRCRVSLEHVTQELHEYVANKTKKQNKNAQQPLPIFQLFLQQERELRVLRLLPNIVRLHRLLLSHYNRSIDSAEATTLKISTFLEGIDDDHRRENFLHLIQDFAMAWECVRPKLVNYAFKGQLLREEFTPKSIDVNSRLATLLPYLRGWGLCSVALVYYLCDLQNNFMEAYCKTTGQKCETLVSVQDTNSSHLICFHPERDLQPILLANCNYSLEVGKGTKVEYDFAQMEAQVLERFVSGRPRLDFQMNFIVFREDFTNAAMFTQLRGMIAQERLPNPADIEKQFNQKLPEVNDLLANLDIAIGFLVSIGGDSNELVVKFMVETLKMKLPPFISAIAKCRLKHVEDLWLRLAFMRARMQANYGQEAFESVEAKYREPIPEDAIRKLRLGLEHMNIDIFLPLLFECIIMAMCVKQDVNKEDYVDNQEHPLKYVLVTYMEAKGMDTDVLPVLSDNRFPDEILVKHCIETWLLALRPRRGYRV